MSAPFVVHERYGTRCSTLLLVERNGRTTMLERRFDAAGALSGSSRIAFDSMDVPERWRDNDDKVDADLRDTRALHQSFDDSAE